MSKMDPPPSEWRSRIEYVLTEAWKRPFYRDHWRLSSAKQVVELAHSNSLHELPIVRRSHLRDHWDRIIDFTDAVDVCSTSGTTGRPVDVPVHRDEYQIRVSMVRRALSELGVRPGNRVLTLLSLNDMFTLGPLVWLATKSIGACAVRQSAQRVDRVLQIIEFIRPEFVVGNPIVLARIAEEAKDAWPEPETMPTKRAFFGAAASFDSSGSPTPAAKAVEQFWGVGAGMHINHFGCSETGPVGHECLHHGGMHIYDDFNLVQLVDPDTGTVVTDSNRPGEVVVTALTQPRGFLPIRYSMGDIVAWMRTDRCSCGRSSARLGPVLGRVDHQLRVDGQTVFPDLLLNIVDSLPGVCRSAVRVATDPLLGEVVTVLVVSSLEAKNIQNCIEEKLRRNLAVVPKIEIMNEAAFKELEDKRGKRTNMVKIPRFFDFRNNS